MGCIKEIEGVEGGVIKRARIEVLPSGITQVVISVDFAGEHGCLVTTSGGVVVTGCGGDGTHIYVEAQD